MSYIVCLISYSQFSKESDGLLNFLSKFICPWTNIFFLTKVLLVVVLVFVTVSISIIMFSKHYKGYLSRQMWIELGHLANTCMDTFLLMMMVSYVGIPLVVWRELQFLRDVESTFKEFNAVEVFDISALKRYEFFGVFAIKKKVASFEALTTIQQEQMINEWIGSSRDFNFRQYRIICIVQPFVIVAILALLDVGYILIVK